MNLHFSKQLKRLKEAEFLTPSEEWTRRNRASLLAQMRQEDRKRDEQRQRFFDVSTIRHAADIFLPPSFRLFLRPALNVLLVAAMTVGGWAVTVSASSSLPGDTLYNVKLATEKISSIGRSEEKTAELHLEFAARRADEVKKVMEKNGETSRHVQGAIESLQKSMEVVSDGLQNVKDPAKAVTLAIDVNQKTSEIADSLKDVAEKTGDANSNLAKEVAKTEKEVQDAGMTALGVIVENQTSGETSITQDQVKELVAGKIDQIIEKTNKNAAAAQEVKDVKEVKEVVLPLAVSVASSSAFSSSTLFSSSSLSFSLLSASSTGTGMSASVGTSTAEQIVTKAAAVMAQTTEAAETVKKELTQAKAAVEQNQLKAAFETVKKAGEITTDIKQAVQETKQEVKKAVESIEFEKKDMNNSLGGVASSTASGTMSTASGTIEKKLERN